MRYPILHKLKDRLNQTWYQIRIGDRLAYISALDAQPDNGLPVLTYHHILRDEKHPFSPYFDDHLGTRFQ
ncbi:hypothetical protein ACLB1M_04310 [Escherichia coli]